MTTKIFSAEVFGVEGRLVEIEVDTSPGLHSFVIVGLADKSLNEARERLNSAIKHSGVKPPYRENRRITINLAPADTKKSGSHYDLGLALGYILSTGQITPFDSSKKIFLGELGLDGSLRPVRGALVVVETARELGFEEVFLPLENAGEVSMVKGIKVVPLLNLSQAIRILEKKESPPLIHKNPSQEERVVLFDFSEIKGQQNAKRALLIAAAGNHNILLLGSPGVGKSFLAQSLVGILPNLSEKESIEVTKIYGAAGLFPKKTITSRPFRNPHHNISLPALIGGGQDPRPGEISLAHRGVLFLDEAPEFQRGSLESLRQPLESGGVRVGRIKGSLFFPSRFMLVLAMNPCPCGYYGDEEKQCSCSPYEVLKYQKRISGPLLDRIDLQVKVRRVPIQELQNKDVLINKAIIETESVVFKRLVEMTREKQRKRFSSYSIETNAEMSSKQVDEFVSLSPTSHSFLKKLETHHLSPRSYYRLLKTAQTIADIEDSPLVEIKHLAEAFSYRLKEE